MRLVAIAPARKFDRVVCRQHCTCFTRPSLIPRTAYQYSCRLSGFVVHSLFGVPPLSPVAQQGATTYNASPCPAGTFGPNPGAKLSVECVVCPVGSFCQEGAGKAEVRDVPLAAILADLHSPRRASGVWVCLSVFHRPWYTMRRSKYSAHGTPRERLLHYISPRKRHLIPSPNSGAQ